MSSSFLKVVLTREIEKSEKLRELLTQHSVPVMLWPLIQIQFLSLVPFREILERKNYFDWLLFPSPNAVHGFFKGLAELDISKETWRFTRTAVVGDATASALSEYGSFQPLVPETQQGVELVRLLTQQNIRHALLASGKQTLLIEELKTQQIPFDFIPCYHTEPVPPVNRPRIDLSGALFVFASPSAIDSFLLSHTFKEVQAVVTIGKTTAKHLEKHFSGPFVIAKNPSDEGLLNAVLELFSPRPLKRI